MPQVNIKYLRTKPGWAVIKEWIAKRITQLLGLEEEVLIGMVFNLLEDNEVRARQAYITDCGKAWEEGVLTIIGAGGGADWYGAQSAGGGGGTNETHAQST
eukprot:1160545-Pelagomonas_calceolata.AAC.15